MLTEVAPQNSLQRLPDVDRESFLWAARENMAIFGDAPYQIGSLVTNRVVDGGTQRMAYKERPEYLDVGSHSAAFVVSPGDQEAEHVLTVTLPLVTHDRSIDTSKVAKGITDDRLEALWRARGIKGHVQLTAADRGQGLVVATKAPGKEVSAHAGPIAPTREHWKQLRRTARSIRHRRIAFDSQGNNVHWDPVAGFTLYDTRPVELYPRQRVRPRKLVRAIKKSVETHNELHSNEGS